MTTVALPIPKHSSADDAARPAAARLKRLSVLMPVYNERTLLEKIVRRVLDVELPLELELVAVDDGSTDGSWEVLQQLAAGEARIRAIRLDRNRGKGTAVREAIERMTGDVAVIQDADLEYDPSDFGQLLEPIVAGRADAVFGSRYAAATKPSRWHWHTWVNRSLTFLSNRVTGLRLSDMETCYKMVRADVLLRLRLTSRTFTLEPELACRLARFGARIEEVPVSYQRRTWAEGKKIGPLDGLKAVWAIARCGLIDRRHLRLDADARVKIAEESRLL